MTIVEITRGVEQLRELLEQKRPVLVDHYVDGCQPCVQIARVLPDIASKFPTLIIAKVNCEGTSDNETYAEECGIDSYPHLHMYSAEGMLVNDDVFFSNKSSNTPDR
jgi:thioredoxin-like negative regulator of GroEL